MRMASGPCNVRNAFFVRRSMWSVRVSKTIFRPCGRASRAVGPNKVFNQMETARRMSTLCGVFSVLHQVDTEVVEVPKINDI